MFRIHTSTGPLIIAETILRGKGKGKMDFQSYMAQRRQDPEYRATEEQLKPILDLADEVFELRMERGWTQEELAERVGTGQANISRLENGLSNPTFQFLHRLSEAFGLEFDFCLRGSRRETKLCLVPILLTEGYQDLFTMSVDVSTRRETLGEIVESRVAA